MSHLKGRSEKVIFININDGIGYYNGSDIQTVFKLDSNFLFSDVMLFEKDVFLYVLIQQDVISLLYMDS
jgi:hypothetical protein